MEKNTKITVVKGFDFDAAAADVIKVIRKSIITVEEHFDLLLHTEFIKKTLNENRVKLLLTH